MTRSSVLICRWDGFKCVYRELSLRRAQQVNNYLRTIALEKSVYSTKGYDKDNRFIKIIDVCIFHIDRVQRDVQLRRFTCVTLCIKMTGKLSHESHFPIISIFFVNNVTVVVKFLIDKNLRD